MYADEESTVRTGHGTMNWFKIGKGVHQGCIFCLFDLYTEYIMRNVELDDLQAGILDICCIFWLLFRLLILDALQQFLLAELLNLGC